MLTAPAGKDCIGGSRTGSGKTVAFAVPILQNWARDPFGVFAVVLTPTRSVSSPPGAPLDAQTDGLGKDRELAIQIAEQFTALGAPQNVKICLLIGGVDMRAQALQLATRPHIVIATPGRMADHIGSSGEDTICGLRRCKMVVLDEADRMLSESFADDLAQCLGVLPKSGGTGQGRQTLLFTATMTDAVKALKEMERQPDRREVFVCEVDTPDATTTTTTIAVPRTL